MFHSGSGTQFMLHRLRTTASCLWLYVAPHSTLNRGAVTGLSYPSTLSFPRCQLRQVSPCSPRMSPYAQKPSCAALVALLRYAPRVGLHPLSLDNRSLGHFLPSAVSASPNALCHVVGDRLGRKKESHLLAPIAAAPALLEACGCSVCSIPGWRPGIYRDGSSVCLFRRCVFCSWRSAL